jgi:hypothetical protein
VTLNTLKPGESAYITEIKYNDHTLRPITLGLIEGALVKCLTQHNHLMELEFFGQTMAISKHTAKRYSCKKLGEIN